jgi:hypothetical protein
MSINRYWNFRRLKCDQEDEKIVKYKDLTIEMGRMWNVQNENDTSNNSGSCSHPRVTQITPEQHTGNFDVKELEKTTILGTAKIFYFGKY